ncbi:MAG: hypothetical protein ABI361_03335 [Nitrososphaera sp.]
MALDSEKHHHESCRSCGSDEIVFNIRVIKGKQVQIRLCNACGALDRL